MNVLARVLLVAATAAALAPLGAQATCSTWIDKLEAGYKITFDGRTYNSVLDNTEFCWTVEVDKDFSSTGKIKGLSHWVIGVCPGSTLISTSGPAAEGNLLVDPTTGLYGHKWDHAMEDGDPAQQFCITLAGDIPLSSSDMTFDGTATTKGGTICSTCDIEGPGCPRACPTDECPPGQIRDTDTCECQCINKDLPCAIPAQVLNLDTCVCECPSDPTCTFPKGQTNECECLCEERDDDCPIDGQVRDPDTCVCDCETPPACVAPAVQVGCGCECPDEDCPIDGQVRDPDTCVCGCADDPTCLSPKERTDECECLCQERDTACDFPGQVRDPDTCECECVAIPICIAPTELVGCDCLCDPSGAAEAQCLSDAKFWNPDACRCDDDPPIVVCKTVKAKCGCPYVKDWDAVDCIKIVWVENDTGRCDDSDDTD